MKRIFFVLALIACIGVFGEPSRLSAPIGSDEWFNCSLDCLD